MPLMVAGWAQPTRWMVTGSVWVKWPAWANGSCVAYETGWLTGRGWEQTARGLAWRQDWRPARAMLRAQVLGAPGCTGQVRPGTAR
jgi:hypothetical protein